ncbi:hypothetical protein TWF696_008032 [Orbilia brochopaga]|uniref:Adenosine deaminase domain-containing protein n=1 Tax=Orbilia brochopaga TaxID=3140254 RepID=A0AAV9ULV3_9PEZI
MSNLDLINQALNARPKPEGEDPFFAKLPKCELHVHLEGTIWPVSAILLSGRNGIHIPIPEVVNVTGPLHLATFKEIIELEDFHHIYYATTRLIQQATDYGDLYLEYLLHAQGQNIMHVEMSFDPHARGLDGARIPLDTILGGIEAAQGARMLLDLEISASMIMCFSRGRPAEEADQILTELLRSSYRGFVVGVGLDSREKRYPAIEFKDVFARANEAGLKTAMHCDINEINSIGHIRQAIYDIGVDRIIHGLDITIDPSLIPEVIERKISFACCPFSYLVKVPGFKRLQIKQLLESGVLLSINSDYPGMYDWRLTDNFQLVGESTIPDSEIVKAARNSIATAWLPEIKKQEMFDKLDRYINDCMVEWAREVAAQQESDIAVEELSTDPRV